MNTRKQLKKRYAEYLRNYLKKHKPPEWDTQLFGQFPGTATGFQKYFERILKQGANPGKVNAVELRFGLKKYTTFEQKKMALEGRCRSIENFFIKKTLPYESNLEFMAEVFDVPIKSIDDFSKTTVENSSNENDDFIKKSFSGLSRDRVISFWKKQTLLKKAAPAIFSLIFAAAVFLFLPYNSTGSADGVSKASLITTPQGPPTGFFPQESRGLVVSIAPIDSAASVKEKKLTCTTLSIYNEGYLYKEQPWSFGVDKCREDMNSELGWPYNDEIISSTPLLKGRTTLANMSMDVRIRIFNTMDKPVYFSNFDIKVTDTYDAKAENAEYGLYQTRSIEVPFIVTLSNKNLYAHTAKSQQLNPNQAMTLKIRIQGSEKSRDLIYRLLLKMNFTDAEGKKYSLTSDKEYLIGFVGD